ncbi:MAG: uroporphyrinogen decarboxylase [Calditrichaeota bacterium]|nr:MAG: uroporphyrinogen decarboxylase [Calditrichota bacterium]
MTDEQWSTLIKIIRGDGVEPLPVGFIVDSPWLPQWYGISILDYFTNDQLWFDANLRVTQEFKEVMFLPGFWSEYGMCTEPSAFGARCVFFPNAFPHAHKIIHSVDDIATLPAPDPRTDGLLPFMLNRLKLAKPRMEDAGHSIRFAVARGPLNIASYLMGSTEFLTAMMMQPEMIERLIQKVTLFLKEWIALQMETFPSIDGLLLLDDIIGFLGEEQFVTFALPYFKELYHIDVTVKFLHNDAPCSISAPHLPAMGVNLFNMGFEIPLSELKELTRNQVVLLGNIPPRDVLANETPENIRRTTLKLVQELDDKRRIIFSCGGGMPPGVSTENLYAFIRTVSSEKRTS